MCKHLLINDFSLDDLSVIKDFTRLTDENDGYGAILRTNENSIEVLKAIDLASFYMDLTARLVVGDIRTLVVHHRTSTNGVGVEYAHPFEHRGVYLTHNGVVSVPEKYVTRTTNDSEQLLHHLIETDFETASISGYYSCFMLTALDTVVLVDNTAPMWTDGRIYSSHALYDSFDRVAGEMRSLDVDTGAVVKRTEIEVSDSHYGMDKAWLSLGADYRDEAPGGIVYDLPSGATPQNVIDFFDLIMPREEHAFSVLGSGERYDYVRELAYSMGLDVSPENVWEIAEMLEKKETSEYHE